MIDKIKNSAWIIAMVFIVLFVLKVIGNINLREQLELEKANTISQQTNTQVWKDKYDATHSKSIELALTIGRLANSKDSIDQLITSVINQNKVNKKKLEEVGYILNKIAAKGTYVLDTTYIIVKKDTCFNAHNDKWLTETVCFTKDSLYTDIIAISEDILTFSDKKVTEDPPKKWWIQRLFQKKIHIMEVEITNTNPYIVLKNQKFTHIIK